MVDATELKTNFKRYAGIASSGDAVLIKRPKKESNLILINESSYNQWQRIMAYLMKLQGFTSLEEVLKQEETKTYYSEDFINAFGSLDEDDLVRPPQLGFEYDCKREELL
ncbi:MAG: hypothetical protein MJ105_01885 [Lachnospiraceae bacterium]|nr:hypothetical protein [Lachnospiraceae bacterium]